MVSGTVRAVHDFGVFVHLDGEPDSEDPLGFVRVPEISRRHFGEFDEVIAVGDRVRGEVLDVDEQRGQVSVSLKALQPDPFVPLAGRIGEVVRGPVTKVFEKLGVFVRVADGAEALVPRAQLRGEVREGDEMTVEIAEVDLVRRRVLASRVPVVTRFLTSLTKGAVVEVTVGSIRNFGAFVHLDGEPGPGPSGLVRIPEVAWPPVGHPSEVLSVGERVRALVVHVDHEREQVSLSIAQARDSRD
ncbi:S1 RNA-binding domain-containing protein [Lentzea sp. NPDC004789]